MKRTFSLLAALVILAAAALGVHLFLRTSNSSKPAVLTPTMSVHREFSDELGPRIYRVLHAQPVVSGEHDKLIALTFDDGPYPVFTPLLLDQLEDLRVPATFFLIGRDAMEWPSLAHRIEADGDEVGDHTYSHPADFDREPPARVREEILRGRDVLWSLTHDDSVKWIMRPPHGRYSEQTLRVAQSLGYHVVLWTDDSGDWRSIPSQRIVEHVEHYATRPEILLMHSGKLATIDALPPIVAAFRAAGYRFVTVEQLLNGVGAEAINHPEHRSL